MNTISPDFFYKSCEINWEWRTEKPFKKNKNLGNIVIFWNFFSMNNTKWKSFFLKTKQQLRNSAGLRRKQKASARKRVGVCGCGCCC